MTGAVEHGAAAHLPDRVYNLILEEASKEYLTVHDVRRRPGRAAAKTARVRRKCAVRLRALGFSLLQIRDFLGVKHHTSVMHMLKRGYVD